MSGQVSRGRFDRGSGSFLYRGSSYEKSWETRVALGFVCRAAGRLCQSAATSTSRTAATAGTYLPGHGKHRGCRRYVRRWASHPAHHHHALRHAISSYNLPCRSCRRLGPLLQGARRFRVVSGQESAIHVQRNSGGVARRIAGQIKHRAGHFTWIGHTLERDLRQCLLEDCIVFYQC